MEHNTWKLTYWLGGCRHCILYPLQLGPPFLNDGKILKPKVNIGLDQIINWLEESFYGKYNSFMNKKNLFLENEGHWNPKATYIGLMYEYGYTGSRTQLGFQKLWKVSFSALKLRFGMNPTSFGSRSKPLFFNYMVYFKGT